MFIKGQIEWIAMSNSNTYILSDEDADGMCSSRIMHNAVTSAYPNSDHTLVWQNWDVFGLKEGDIDKILEAKPRTAYILDIGSGLDMLNQTNRLLENNINVVILDNHPPDPVVETSDTMHKFRDALDLQRKKYPFPPTDSYPTPYFFYKSTTESCTTAIAYNYCSTMGLPLTNMEKWALLGIKGDVASESAESGPIFDNLLDKHLSFAGLLSSKDLGGSYNWGIIDFYAQLLHVPRRMLFNEAPPIVYAAMKEMETIPNWLPLYDQVFNKESSTLGSVDIRVGTPKYPATERLLSLELEWKKEHVKVEGRGQNIRLDYSDFGVTIVSHKWNLGSALASKLSGINKKTWFVINTITDKGVHVSGRGSDTGRLHIGKVFRSCDPSVMEGGGLQPAGSATTHTTNVEAILDALVKGVQVSKR
jgi:hypothetical protein